MSLSDKQILFWGPQCVAYWNQHFCAPVFEPLKQYGWNTSYFFPPENEFGTGLDKAWQGWFTDHDPLPDYRIIDDLSRSVYAYQDPVAVAEALREPLGHERPDIIITRTNGHDYLRLLFPGVPILTMGEAIGAPWFNQHCFSLSPDLNFQGLPHLGRFASNLLTPAAPETGAVAALDNLTQMQSVPDDALRTTRQYFDTLREKYDRIYLFAADYTGPECLYLFDAFEKERFSGNADVIHHFKNGTDDRTALLVTQHPFQYLHKSTTNLSEIFHPAGRVITQDHSALDKSLFQTSFLAQFSDGLIVRNSKAFWYALAGEKPLLNLGSQDLSVVGANQNLEDFLGAKEPGTSRENAAKVFYWHVTRQRVALDESEKLSKTLNAIMEKFADTPNLKKCASLFEWGNEADYRESFEHCIRTYNENF